MSWLQHYLDFTRDQESPERFHFWAGVSILSAVVNRNIWVDRRSHGITRYRTYPGCTMIFLVAGSGKTRKSTAMRLAMPFLKSANIHLVKGKSSPESFLDQLDPIKIGNKDSIGMLFCTELTNFITKASYADALVDLLTELGDGDDEFVFTTRGGGKIKLTNICLTGFGATTPEALGLNMPEKAHGTGFQSRILYIYADDTDRIDALCDPDDQDISPAEVARNKTLEQYLMKELEKKALLRGPFKFTPDGRAWYKAWYEKWRNSPENTGDGYNSRRQDHLIRLTQILTISRQNDLVMDMGTFIAADTFLKQVELDLPKAFAFIGDNSNRGRDKIIATIRQNGGVIDSTKLYHAIIRHFQSKDDVQKSLEFLRAAGLIVYVGLNSNGQEVWKLP